MKVHRIRRRRPGRAKHVRVNSAPNQSVDHPPDECPRNTRARRGRYQRIPHLSSAGINSRTSAAPQGPLFSESTNSVCPLADSGASTIQKTSGASTANRRPRRAPDPHPPRARTPRMIPAESRHLIDCRILPPRIVPSRQHDPAPHRITRLVPKITLTASTESRRVAPPPPAGGVRGRTTCVSAIATRGRLARRPAHLAIHTSE